MSLWSALFGKPAANAASALPHSTPTERLGTQGDIPGNFRGRFYTEWVSSIDALKRDGRYAEAEELLLGCIEAVEAEARVKGTGWTLAPGYYKHLAIVRRKEKNYAGEVEVLERYLARQDSQPMRDRLAKAKALLEKQRDGAT